VVATRSGREGEELGRDSTKCPKAQRSKEKFHFHCRF
jgi:hypothetical protein